MKKQTINNDISAKSDSIDISNFVTKDMLTASNIFVGNEKLDNVLTVIQNSINQIKQSLEITDPQTDKDPDKDPDQGNTDINNPISLNKVIPLTTDWKFKLINTTSNLGYTSTKEASKSFDDSSWQTVSVPHDWSIHLNFKSYSSAGFQGGYLDGGDAWYRRKLDVSSYSGQRIYLYFDGVYMESDLYINGSKVGINRMGYNPFYFDITNYLKFDDNDLLALLVRNKQPGSRWYSGSGIYRNVYLLTAGEVEVELDSIFITTPELENNLKSNKANTQITATIINNTKSSKSVKVKNSIYYKNSLITSNTQNITLGAGTTSFSDTISISNPVLWDIHKGNLYVLLTEVYDNDTKLYSKATSYGYRYFKFDSNTGFWLNGNNVKFKGVCMHHDLGCLGAAVNESAIKRQIQILKKMGVNAIRLTHNPSSPQFMDVCAEEGIMMIEETFDVWKVKKVNYDFARYFNDNYAQVLRSAVKAARNNPGVIMYSLGNEIYDCKRSIEEFGAPKTVQVLKSIVKELDSTRPITMGEDAISSYTAQQVMKEMDVIGLNYASKDEYALIRNLYPNKPIYGSETASALSSRGIYARDGFKHQYSSFDDNYVNWGDSAATAMRRNMEEIPYLAGEFVWTGFDYIGEPTEWNQYPCKSSYFGIVDLAGFPKDIYYMYQSQWTTTPMIHIVADWTGSGNKKVWLYSNCNHVELFLNGVSLGKKSHTDMGNSSQYEYSTKYTKGILVAQGYNNEGTLIAQDVKKSFNSPSSFILTSDKTSLKIGSNDLAFIECTIIDSDGAYCATANNKITFTINGGTIIAVDNGDSTCVDRFDTNIRKAFSGKALCVIKADDSKGDIKLTASGDNLISKSIIITKSDKSVTKSDSTPVFVGIDGSGTQKGGGEISPTEPVNPNNPKDDPSKEPDDLTSYEIYLDASNHGSENNIWQDLSGHGNDVMLYNFTHDGNTNGWINNSLVFNGINTYGLCSSYKPFSTLGGDFEFTTTLQVNNTYAYESYLIGLMEEIKPWYGLKLGTLMDAQNDISSELRLGSSSVKFDTIKAWDNFVTFKIILKDGKASIYVDDELKANNLVTQSMTINQPLYLGANIINNKITRFASCKIKTLTLKRL
ncbi:glycoside hydrolase family 2 TIM barrel-domain containing protein [uncultured Clostridium sp.]|uniref:glycoside hydrolase family 2 TIM barrel-domain containing protein n=1 Tax=uncultured Clostridium sp. TaxID=59620 RepID=UPI0025F8D90D|nr:glycoside hydrolase family 2 TIM barrel-domain containing protein [uncultured Clostridium sp.]